MKFALLYNITLIVQGKCLKCTRLYKTPNRFYTIFKQLELDIRTIIDSFYFLFFIYFTKPNYAIRQMRNDVQHIYYFVSKKQKIIY